MIKVDINELKKVLKPADYILQQKENNIAIRSGSTELQLDLNMIDNDIQFCIPLVEKVKETLPVCAVDSNDFWRVIKVMDGVVSMKITGNGLLMTGSGNKYLINLLGVENEFFNDFSKGITPSGLIDNKMFKTLLKHTNEKSDDDTKYIYFGMNHWYATDNHNSVRFPDSISCSELLIDGRFAKFIGNVRENLNLSISQKNETQVIFLNNSNYKIAIRNCDMSDETFTKLPELFNKKYKYVASFDSKDMASKYNNLKTVISSGDFEDGVSFTIDEKDGNIFAITPKKEGEENVRYHNVHQSIQMITDSETVDKVLYCCDDNVVDMYMVDTDQTSGQSIFKIQYDDVQQLFKADWNNIV